LNIKLGKVVGSDTECYVACKNSIVLHLSSGVCNCTVLCYISQVVYATVQYCVISLKWCMQLYSIVLHLSSGICNCTILCYISQVVYATVQYCVISLKWCMQLYSIVLHLSSGVCNCTVFHTYLFTQFLWC